MTRARLLLWVAAVLGACTPPPPPGDGLVGDDLLNPFPYGALHTEDGRVALDATAFGLPDDLTPLRVERLAWREGFSVAQTAVVRLDEVDAAALPAWRDAVAGEGGVRLYDRDGGRWLPVMAELDQHPEAVDHTLLIRPLVVLPVGHRVAVVLTTDVTPPLPRFQAALGRRPPPELAHAAADLAALVDELDAAGLPSEQIALAWDFPVADGTAPLRSAWAQVPAGQGFVFDPARDVDAGDPVPPATWRITRGRFTSTDFLVDDVALQLEADGGVSPTGQVEVVVDVVLPASVADAAAGSVPVLVFGHGLFATPGLYLDQPDDPSRLNALANELGAVVLALRWRGLSTPDLGGALGAANDFARIHELTDRVVQAQANLKALLLAIEDGAVFADALFEGRDGQPLVDPTRVAYYGISLGAIEGFVMLADDPPVDHAVLHVGGGGWSTMLERSSNWPLFEALLVPAVPDALVRQRLYAVSQLWWDPVDPLSYADALRGRPLLLQEAIGDQQVPNLSTRILARSAGLSLLTPEVEPVAGLSTAPADAVTAALVQLDPQAGLPTEGNRPAEDNGAHEAPRRWPGVQAQTVRHLRDGSVVHACGDGPCAADRTGE